MEVVYKVVNYVILLQVVEVYLDASIIQLVVVHTEPHVLNQVNQDLYHQPHGNFTEVITVHMRMPKL